MRFLLGFVLGAGLGAAAVTMLSGNVRSALARQWQQQGPTAPAL